MDGAFLHEICETLNILLGYYEAIYTKHIPLLLLLFVISLMEIQTYIWWFIQDWLRSKWGECSQMCNKLVSPK